MKRILSNLHRSFFLLSFTIQNALKDTSTSIRNQEELVTQCPNSIASDLKYHCQESNPNWHILSTGCNNFFVGFPEISNFRKLQRIYFCAYKLVILSQIQTFLNIMGISLFKCNFIIYLTFLRSKLYIRLCAGWNKVIQRQINSLWKRERN